MVTRALSRRSIADTLLLLVLIAVFAATWYCVAMQWPSMSAGSALDQSGAILDSSDTMAGASMSALAESPPPHARTARATTGTHR